MADAVFSVFGALSGCIGCMVCVESLAKQAPSAMNLLTFATFLFISIEGLIFTTRFFTVKNKISLRGYLPVVLAFFACNVINNQALNFHVPVPLHIIFRSGSLLTSLLMNRLLLGRKYSSSKYASVFAITIGICLCTLATAGLEKKADSLLPRQQAEKHYREWLIGIFMLTAALLISSLLAICQERMYRIYGKHPREAMFYTHAVSLPFFAFMGNDIAASAEKFSLGPKAEFFGFLLPISTLWLQLLAVAFLQWFCIMFVYRLNASIDSLSVTLVVTLRKFLSLLISIFWFGNLFTATHWLGATLVFGGTLIFADVP
uniref:UDP-xylose and UDP-N-acetylglucosamine transporter n=1 Tax=Meloidogyne floridensis TaxID=298350 RepID=A0A915NVK7_9BILA